MSGLGRITQEIVEVLGPDVGHARITQETAEPIGPVGGSHARVTQLYCEVLASATDHARVTQLYAEPIGPPGSLARVNQLAIEVAQASSQDVGTDDSWKWNQLIGARVSSNWIDAWTGDKENDLGDETCVTWVSPIIDSGAMTWEKDYRYVTLIAPIQTGIVQVIVVTDPGSPTSMTSGPINIDLSTGPITRNIAIQQANCRGYTAQVTVNFCTTPGLQQPITIWGVGVWGKMDRNLTQWTQNG